MQVLLGEFEANDTHAEQVFPIVNPIWIRYLKLRFLTMHAAACRGRPKQGGLLGPLIAA